VKSSNLVGSIRNYQNKMILNLVGSIRYHQDKMVLFIEIGHEKHERK
jgi:hypothetical protein